MFTGTEVHIVYTDSTGLCHARRKNAIWSDQLIDDGGTEGITGPSLAMAPGSGGNPQVSYIGDFYLRRAVFDGTSWTTENIDYQTEGGPNTFTPIAPNNGEPHVCFFLEDDVAGTTALVHLEGGYADDDDDGMADQWELDNGLDPGDPGDWSDNPDGDGLTNAQEVGEQTHPYQWDPDGDGLHNPGEVHNDCDPNDDHFDNDGMKDGWEVDHTLDPDSDDSAGDPDGDGLDNGGEFANQTDPGNPDSDGDGLNDGAEVNTHGTSPILTDSDGDGDPDGMEVLDTGLDPNDPAEVFHAEVISVTATHETVRWPSTPGRLYTLLRSPDLVTFTAVATDLPSNGGPTQDCEHPETNAGGAFYKIEVRAAPQRRKVGRPLRGLRLDAG